MIFRRNLGTQFALPKRMAVKRLKIMLISTLCYKSFLLLGLLAPQKGHCQNIRQFGSEFRINKSSQEIPTYKIKRDFPAKVTDLTKKLVLQEPPIEEQQEIRELFKSQWGTGRAPSIKRAGGWSGGGGTGWACTIDSLNFNEEVLDSQGKIRLDSYGFIKRIGVLDELSLSDDEYGAMITIEPAEHLIHYFTRILQPYKQVHPTFFLDLTSAIEIVSRSYYRSEYSGPLERTNDIGELSPRAKNLLNSSNCGLVQMAVRYSYRDETGRLQKAFILFDNRLRDKLERESDGQSRLSYLILHEAIYLLAKSTNAKPVHDLATWLMSYYTFLNYNEPKNHPEFSTLLNAKLEAIGYKP